MENVYSNDELTDCYTVDSRANRECLECSDRLLFKVKECHKCGDKCFTRDNDNYCTSCIDGYILKILKYMILIVFQYKKF